MTNQEAIDLLNQEEVPMVLNGKTNENLVVAHIKAIQALEEKQKNRWITFDLEYDDDLQMEILQGKIPEEDEEILVTDGENVWIDTFMRDGVECYLDSGSELINMVIAWKPLPEPYYESETD